MRIKTLHALSNACFVAGNVCIVASAALYGAARMRKDTQLRHDGLFVGLWAPSFFALGDHFATAALARTEQARFDEADERYGAPLRVDTDAEPMIQSPRPLQHVGR